MKIKINVDNGSISAARVASLAGGRLAGAVDAADKKDISCVCTDSREVCPGALFVAIAGERTDGHKYIGAAVLSGAAAVLVETETQCKAVRKKQCASDAGIASNTEEQSDFVKRFNDAHHFP